VNKPVSVGEEQFVRRLMVRNPKRSTVDDFQFLLAFLATHAHQSFTPPYSHARRLHHPTSHPVLLVCVPLPRCPSSSIAHAIYIVINASQSQPPRLEFKQRVAPTNRPPSRPPSPAHLSPQTKPVQFLLTYSLPYFQSEPSLSRPSNNWSTRAYPWDMRLLWRSPGTNSTWAEGSLNPKTELTICIEPAQTAQGGEASCFSSASNCTAGFIHKTSALPLIDYIPGQLRMFSSMSEFRGVIF